MQLPYVWTPSGLAGERWLVWAEDFPMTSLHPRSIDDDGNIVAGRDGELWLLEPTFDWPPAATPRLGTFQRRP